MKIDLSPTYIEILGFPVDVAYVPADGSTILDHSSMGKTVVARGKMYIDEDIQGEQHIATLFHEIIEYGNVQLELGLEHRQISGLETIITSALRSMLKNEEE